MTKAHDGWNGARQGISLLACLLLALLLLPCTAYAAKSHSVSKVVDTIGQNGGYTAILYDNTNGLPTSEANDIVQTPEGFIWIGSYGGLIRYDGNTFERMSSDVGVGGVVCLHVDSQERLWIGTNDCGLALMERDKIHRWREEDGLGSDKICDIEEGPDGTIYVGTTEGVTIFTPDLTLKTVADHRVSSAYIERLSLGPDGLLYCTTNEDDYFTLRKGKLVDYADHKKTSIQGITCIFPDPNNPGELYVGTDSSGLYYGDPKHDPEELRHVDTTPLTEISEVCEIEGRIWICGRNGIGTLDDQGFNFLDNLPLNTLVDHVIEDYEGNIWFTSTRQGVMKLAANQFSDVFGQYSIPSAVVNTTCMCDDMLLVGTDAGLLAINADGLVTTIPLTEAKDASGNDLGATDLLEWLDGCRVRSIIRDSQDRYWISTWRAFGLIRYKDGKATVFSESDGIISNHIRAVSETNDGSILVACTGGMCVIEGDQVTKVYHEEDGIENPETLTVCAAPNGDAIVGSNGGGIYVVNESGIRCIGTEDGLTSGIVMRIKYDARRGVFWIVTSNSLAYMTEDYKVTTIEDFPYSNNFDLYENSQGQMWILSSNGLYVLPADDMIANREINPAHYGLANGLPGIATSNSYSALTPEGNLYIASNSGVSKVNIETPLLDITDLKQDVPFVDADGVRIYPDATGRFLLPSTVKKLTVHPFVYTYSLTDPQVSYRLEGFDDENTVVNRSELGPVTYTNLPGGSYRFVMELKDALGRGGKTLSVSIVKTRGVHEYVWPYLLAALCAGLVLVVMVRSYDRKQMRAMEQRHKEEAEKERIANELHLANRIQGSMLPNEFPPYPDRSEFDIYASMDPAREVGGDFYDFFLIDDDHLCMVIADVSGKGIPAALFMMISKVTLQSYALAGELVADVLTKTNESLCSNNQADMFVTVWLGVLEISTGRLVAANAGHEYPVVKRAGSQFELLRDKHGLVIGAMDGIRYRAYEMQLSPGDSLFVYTDGVPEATDVDEKMFGTERMVDALNEDPDATPQELLVNVRRAVDDFVKEAEQFDDLTMLCMTYRGPSE